MKISLFHLVFLLLIPTLSFRIWVIYNGVKKFEKIFDGRENAREGSKLIDDLEIPGLNSFKKQEIILGLAPYFVLLFLMTQSRYVNIIISDLDLILTLSTAIIFLIWFVFDIIKSISIHKELTKLAKDTSRLKKIAGSTLDGLRFIIHRKGMIKRTAIKYTTGIVKEKLENQQKEKESFVRTVGISSLKAIESIISFPELVTEKLCQWMKEDLDGRLMKRFNKYSDRSIFKITINIIWLLVPALWVILVYYIV